MCLSFCRARVFLCFFLLGCLLVLSISSLVSSCALDTEGGMDIVSCGEDGSVLVWSGAELVQSVPHPCCVWTVKALPGTGMNIHICCYFRCVIALFYV
jgi:hypothetical protein